MFDNGSRADGGAGPARDVPARYSPRYIAGTYRRSAPGIAGTITYCSAPPRTCTVMTEQGVSRFTDASPGKGVGHAAACIAPHRPSGGAGRDPGCRNLVPAVPCFSAGSRRDQRRAARTSAGHLPGPGDRPGRIRSRHGDRSGRVPRRHGDRRTRCSDRPGEPARALGPTSDGPFGSARGRAVVSVSGRNSARNDDSTLFDQHC